MDETLRAHYEIVLSDLTRQRTELERQIQEIEQSEAALKRRLGIEMVGVAVGSKAPESWQAPRRDSSKSGAVANLSTDEFAGMTIFEAACAYLEKVGRPSTPVEIAAALLKHGLSHSSKRLATPVSTALARDARSSNPTFYSPRRGKWGLARWYDEPEHGKSGGTTGRSTAEAMGKRHKVLSLRPNDFDHFPLEPDENERE